MAALPLLAPALAGFASDVHAGLSKTGQKTLPCRYFYDDVGTALFQTITHLPEYGLTRADERIIRYLAEDLASLKPFPGTVVELGSGSGAKTRWILEVLSARRRIAYFPIDISPRALANCRRDLSDLAEVRPLETSYLEGVARAVSGREPGDRILILFLGSTIGNFERPAMAQFLREVRGCLREGDALLLGTDLEKAESNMILAYDDPAGVTAAFNLNLLARINRELRANFVVRQFEHQVRYDRCERRIEMHLRSRSDQTVFIQDAELVVRFQRGETIWTESSHKFRSSEISALAAAGGFECAQQWVDQEWPFAESLLIAG